MEEQFIQSDKYLGFLFEQHSWFTVVPIDSRAHRLQTLTPESNREGR